ncbi:MAG: hypothetical protein QRY16_14335 [Enterobacterales bacterium endosymbiont of Blomia tropicalis]|uniref:hypothetical protein n=1 Tax=Mixta mediterraneensis TaxID=2758443 RepID=UPI0025A82E90|nr:hypothetical protein [Mixta mediterraneensis]MDL4914919.1 hypothetical protein [Mixta mediterraneensis]
MKRRYLFSLLPVLFIIGCAQRNTAPEAFQKKPLMQVQVDLSPQAREALLRGNESIIVSASWYGWPLPGKENAADDVGQIDLGRPQILLPASAGVARFAPSSLKSERLDWIKEGVQVDVNVYSARHHWPDNILACDAIDGALSEVNRQTVMLNCSLISEQQPGRVGGRQYEPRKTILAE